MQHPSHEHEKRRPRDAISLPAYERLHELLTYNPESGQLLFKARRRENFASNRWWLAWNSRYANKPAFQVKTSDGGFKGRIDGVNYHAARVIWKMVHGFDPVIVDHINGNRADNRLKNLRNISKADNAKNTRLNCRNTSGVMGVVFNRRMGKWQARIGARGNAMELGTFSSKAEAIMARKAAEVELGYHPNHGRTSVPIDFRDPSRVARTGHGHNPARCGSDFLLHESASA